MIVFISPAKGFKENAQSSVQLPLLRKKAEVIMERLGELSKEDIAKLMKVSPELAELNRKRFEDFSFTEGLVAAVDAFDGMAFKSLDAGSLNEEGRSYLTRNLYILSGLYGALRPEDGIRPYRLDVKDRLDVAECKNLYGFWGDSIYKLLQKEADGVFVNLASEEFSKCIIPFLRDETCVTCSFKVLKKGQLKQMSSYSKKGRGAMLRYMAVNNIEDYRELKGFSEEGFSYNEELSSEVNHRIEYVFVKEL